MGKKKKKKRVKVNKPGHFLRKPQLQYASKWEKDSIAFEEQGLYKWMSDFVDDFKIALEVGCGDGRPTLELARRGHRIVSIDENKECLKLAEHRLIENDISCELILRAKIEGNSRAYRTEYGEINPTQDAQVTLIEADAVTDPQLEKWLIQQEAFDCVLCWLIGTHKGRGTDIKVQHLKAPIDYRLHVQNRVYELANRILRSGGRLQIVDRGEEPADQLLRMSCLESHREQASVTSLNVVDMAYKEYQPPTGVKMVATPGLLRPNPDMNRLAMISVWSDKPDDSEKI